MFFRGRVRPSKSASLMGMIVGAIFVVIGLTIVSNFGWFGVVWTLLALGITIGHAVNFFGNRGVSSWDVEIPQPEQSELHNGQLEDFETRLRRLERLRDDGLISEEEYQQKRSEMLSEKW